MSWNIKITIIAKFHSHFFNDLFYVLCSDVFHYSFISGFFGKEYFYHKLCTYPYFASEINQRNTYFGIDYTFLNLITWYERWWITFFIMMINWLMKFFIILVLNLSLFLSLFSIYIPFFCCCYWWVRLVQSPLLIIIHLTYFLW